MGSDWLDFVSSTLAGGIDDSQVTLDVQGGDGATFPEGGRRAVIFASGSATPGDDATREIVRITSKSTDELTIVRGQDGTIAKAWPISSKIWHIQTGAEISDEVRRIVQRKVLQRSDIVELNNEIPIDDTKPEDDEGDEIFTQEITPTKIGNKIRLEANLSIANKSITYNSAVVVALFTSASGFAIAAGAESIPIRNARIVTFTYEYTVASLTPVDIFVRVGRGGTGNMALNRQSDSADNRFDGADNSSFTIEEFTPDQ